MNRPQVVYFPSGQLVYFPSGVRTERAVEFRCAAVLIRPVMYDDLVKEARRVLRDFAAERLG